MSLFALALSLAISHAAPPADSPGAEHFPLPNDATIRGRLCNNADHIFVAEIAFFTSFQATASERLAGAPPIWSEVTLVVEATLLGDDNIATITLRLPGGEVNGIVAQAGGFPKIKTGERYFMALNHLQPEISRAPLLLHHVMVPPGFDLPPAPALQAHFNSYCR